MWTMSGGGQRATVSLEAEDQLVDLMDGVIPSWKEYVLFRPGKVSGSRRQFLAMNLLRIGPEKGSVEHLEVAHNMPSGIGSPQRSESSRS